MPANRCVVFGCSNFSNKSTGIPLHFSPKNKQDDNKWKRFVRLHRANFNPPGRFVVCSVHFEEKCFSRTLHIEHVCFREQLQQSGFQSNNNKLLSVREAVAMTILAALHFNYNCDRESKIDDHGVTKLKVVYAKYKNGEGTVREVRVPQNYDYVHDIFKTLVETPRADLKLLRIELEESVPEPMHNMLEKETKEEAITKHQNRRGKETQIVPPTCTEEQLRNLAQERNAATNGRRVPHYRKCGQRMKAHDKEECNRLYNQWPIKE